MKKTMNVLNAGHEGHVDMKDMKLPMATEGVYTLTKLGTRTWLYSGLCV